MTPKEQELLLYLASIVSGSIAKELQKAGMTSDEGVGGGHIRKIRDLVKTIKEDTLINNK
ncbi:hypothetical protein [Thalassospira marina]|uniref:Uncharacterized protein n=1 Tax=Thalassospira marina TaxID=2048283 RepID=A0A2N3KWU0_9PROT|nr:hypothetical protein [Thalassospira marina]PKR55039.1 hypothetical protein COO20_06540 [Thalassospira marina]